MKKLYGIIGYPIKHSLSPAMHNAAFKHLGIDAEYRPFEVKPGELKKFYLDFKNSLSGINITIPHKEASVKYMEGLKGGAELIGAINTVVIEKGRLIGYNTDEAGFMRSLKEDLGFDASSKKAVIVGAGGAGRAVAFGLISGKIKRMVLTDIIAEKAVALAGYISGKIGCGSVDVIAAQYDKKVIGELALDSDLLVNATPCGMKENDPEIIDAGFLHDKLSVFDLIYNPAETRLIKEAKGRCCKAVNGLGMLVYQGAASFELWTKKKAPVEVMRETLNNTLKNVNR